MSSAEALAPALGDFGGLLSAMCWAVTGLLIRAFGVGINAVTVNALRSTVAGLAFLLVWPVLGDVGPIEPAAIAFLVLSLIAGLGIGDSLYFAAIPRIGVARAMPISMAYPVLTAALAVILLRESIALISAAGMVATLVGVYLVAAPGNEPRISKGSFRSVYWVGIGMALAAAIGWSVATVALGPALEHVDIWTASAVREPLAAIGLWLVALRMGAAPRFDQLGRTSLLVIGATGALNLVATALFLWGVASSGAARTAVLTATSPVFAVPLSILLLGERGTWRVAAGTLCSVAGVILLTLGETNS
jgi:drug/metabolite transporter (DMT)-like permease